MTEEQLSALLRTVKRHEQPPPDYFDQLLRDLHRRQRAELLRRPLWRIAVERMQTFFGEHSMGPLSYAGSMAAVVVLGIATIGIALPGKLERREELAAPQRSVASTTPFTLQPSYASAQAGQGFVKPAQPEFFPNRTTPSLQAPPRYIIDARPVLYDKPAAFSF